MSIARMFERFEYAVATADARAEVFHRFGAARIEHGLMCQVGHCFGPSGQVECSQRLARYGPHGCLLVVFWCDEVVGASANAAPPNVTSLGKFGVLVLGTIDARETLP